MPALKFTSLRFQSFHQSHATLPGLIQSVLPTLLGVAKAYTKLFVGMSTSFSVTANILQGYCCGPVVWAMYGSLESTYVILRHW